MSTDKEMDEKQFFDAVEEGNTGTVGAMLEENKAYALAKQVTPGMQPVHLGYFPLFLQSRLCLCSAPPHNFHTPLSPPLSGYLSHSLPCLLLRWCGVMLSV